MRGKEREREREKSIILIASSWLQTASTLCVDGVVTFEDLSLIRRGASL